MNAELVYNIEDIFGRCLQDYGVEKYFIAPYQRGYKWSSKENGQIPILFDDLKEAFMQPERDYYLQYITIKQNKEDNYLEVIDGQQRLTTLSILLEILQVLNYECVNFSVDKLSYAIRGDLFKERIKNKNQEYWEKLNLDNIDKQDVYYLLSAGKYFFDNLNKDNHDIDLKKFYDFICSHVQLIVNAVEPHIDSEKVFRNLNSNKMPLTDSELIKGLLLTKSAREKGDKYQKRHFKEILEMRAAMGRKWDEITNWVNKPDIKNFFFGEITELEFVKHIESSLKLGISENEAILLLLLSLTVKKDKDIKNSQYLLFNYFHKEAKKQGTNAEYFLEKINVIYSVLNDWFNDDEIYNLLGYLFYTEQINLKLLSAEIETTTVDFKTKLLYNILNDINQIEKLEGKLNYEKNKDLVRKFLLMINLFQTNGKEVSICEYRFPFIELSKVYTESIEHIYSQNPCQMTKVNDEMSLFQYNKDGKYDDNDIAIYNEIFDEFEMEKKQYESSLHTIGNLALVTTSINSSFSNNTFSNKRIILREKIINQGKFVPPHTYNVFNKIYSSEGELNIWSLRDIKEHKENIINKLSFNAKR